jgi:hypothetical protein
MADRPIVLRNKTSSQKLVSQGKVQSQRLMSQGPTGSPALVWRMRTATGRLVHQYRTSSQRLVGQRSVSGDTRLMSIAANTTFVIVLRRKVGEPLFGMLPTATQRVVDQFPTYTDRGP